MSDLIPFGKHKGKPVDALLDDREYVDWLLAQGWFRQRYGNIYQIVINNGQEPSETPEHNAMQIRFLDEEYRLKFACAVKGPNLLVNASNVVLREKLEWAKTQLIERRNYIQSIIDKKYVETVEEWQRDLERVKALKEFCMPCIEGRCGIYRHQEPEYPQKREINYSDLSRFTAYGIEIKNRSTNNLIDVGAPEFESTSNGTFSDVSYTVNVGFSLHSYVDLIKGSEYEFRDERHIYFSSCTTEYLFAIEIKPTISDDYPAVLRQIKRNKSNILLLRSYSGVGATKDQFVQFFKSQGITVVFESDIDTLELPPFDREMVL